MKCGKEAAGGLTVSLTVDMSRHPVLTSAGLAEAAMRQALRLETPEGARLLTETARPRLTREKEHDPGVPVPEDPGGHAGGADLAVMHFSWPPAEGLRNPQFSVPRDFPHDLLFWLDDPARPAGQPVLWNILIAGDTTPPLPFHEDVDVRIPSPGTRVEAFPQPGGTAAVPADWRQVLGAGLLMAAVAGVVGWRRHCARRQGGGYPVA